MDVASVAISGIERFVLGGWFDRAMTAKRKSVQ